VNTGLTDLKALERDAFRRFYDDGLFDVFVGALLVTMGAIATVTDRYESESIVSLLAFGIGMALITPLLLWRRHLLRTRLGTFEPGPERRRKLRGTKLALLASVVMGVIALGVAVAAGNTEQSADVLGAIVPLLWFTNAVCVFGAMAYFLDVPRFYFHGVVMGFAMPLMIWPDLLWDRLVEPVIAFGVPGLIVAAVGICKLVEFLRTYPAPSSEGSLDG